MRAERWLKMAVAHPNRFVQILTILPFVQAVSAKEWKTLFFPRIFDGQLHPMEIREQLMVVIIGRNFKQEAFFGSFWPWPANASREGLKDQR
jgi:hypothetical protein